MNNKRYVARSTAIAARVLGDETMVMSAANSTLFTLDEVATVIWEAADGATPLEEIVAKKVCTQFDSHAGSGVKRCGSLRRTAFRAWTHVAFRPANRTNLELRQG